MSALRRFTDGVLFQAVLTGSLSFSHIHDLAAAHGQDRLESLALPAVAWTCSPSPPTAS